MASVVVTTFNGERFIDATMVSILGQTHRNLELVVVDDGSTDGTLAILDKITDGRVRVIRQSNMGHSAALNAGASACHGDYVAISDHDDISHPERVQRQIAYLLRNPRCALVGTQYETIDECGRVLGPNTVPIGHRAITEELRAQGDCIAGPSVMIRRQALAEVGGYRSLFDVAQDYDLVLRLSENWQLANLPEVLLRWRFQPDCATSRGYARQTALAEAARECARRRRAGLPEDADTVVARALQDVSSRESGAKNRSLLAKAFLSWGVNYFTLGDRRSARCRLWTSLKYRPIQPRAAAFLALAFMPRPLGVRTRAVARRAARMTGRSR